MPADAVFMEKLVALCKRRGFIYQSSEIYGGIGGFWDYGPMGVELKRNIKNQWWHDMVESPPDGPDGHEIEMVGVDCSIIMNPKIWEASGHATGFADPMVDDKETKQRFRADHLQAVFFLEPTPDMTVGRTYLVVSSAPPPGALPSQTIVASSPAEAISLLIGDKKLRKLCGIRDVKSTVMSGASLGAPGYATVWVHTDGGPRYLYVRPCPVALLQQAPHEIPSPFTGTKGVLTEPRQFNLMFRTHYGALEDASSLAYLRPETAQGIFANFKNVLDTTRVKVPFGIAQVGKAFRNEINPRNYTFRSREFEQMEIEFFCRPDAAMQWYEFWRKVRYDWYVRLGLKSEKLRLRDQGPEELAHYSKACADIEYLFPFSDEFQELEGVAHRGNFDLTQHQQFSGKDLTYFDDEAWERDKAKFAGDKEAEKKAKNAEPYRYLPTVIEPSAGVDRSALAFLCEAYTEDQAPDEKGELQTRVVMKFHPKLAPIKVAVFPLVNREGMPDIAYAIYRGVKKHLTAFYDEKGAIGRRYRRQDEVGTPFCVTVDGQTLQDGTVTIRDRDTLAQVRAGKDHVLTWLREKLGTT